MELIQGTTRFLLPEKTAVAIGKFDGIHRGHRRLLQEILDAKEDGYRAAVFTFDPPAGSFFSGKTVKELTTREEKRRIFADLGVDYLVEFPLNARTAAISAEDFILRILVAQMHAGLIAAGMDLSFGDKGAGDARLLAAMAQAGGYQVSIIDKVRLDGREISSTYVREEVAGGNMLLAARLLGCPYQISGIVVHGKQLGRRIGMPTLNLLPPKDKLLPPAGVYYSRTLYQGKTYRSITNLGVKPSVSQEKITTVETYLYDFDREIYGEEITVQLLHFKRPEQKFPSVEALKKNMEKDISEGRIWEYHL